MGKTLLTPTIRDKLFCIFFTHTLLFATFILNRFLLSFVIGKLHCDTIAKFNWHSNQMDGRKRSGCFILMKKVELNILSKLIMLVLWRTHFAFSIPFRKPHQFNETNTSHGTKYLILNGCQFKSTSIHYKSLSVVIFDIFKYWFLFMLYWLEQLHRIYEKWTVSKYGMSTNTVLFWTV